MDKIMYVTCPKCADEYYLERSDYVRNPDGLCSCPFCGHEFAVREGNPRPPLDPAVSSPLPLGEAGRSAVGG